MLESLKIILLCILAAIIYGILHDQITARICLEYFTVFHPPILNATQSPTLLAFGWGVIATWWVGPILGIPVSICSLVGKLPKITARQLLKPIAIILLILGATALVCGIIGYSLAISGNIRLPEVEAQLPKEHFAPFMADAFAHLASYGFGALLGIALCIWILVKRYRRAASTLRRSAVA